MFKQIIILIVLIGTIFGQTVIGRCKKQPAEHARIKYYCGNKNSIKLTFDHIHDLYAKEMRLDCNDRNIIDDYQNFKIIEGNITIKNVTTLHIQDCPINENFTFTNFRNIFNISTIEKIFYHCTNVSFINGDFFESLENLTELTIKVNSTTVIHSDLLKNWKNLRTLVLHNGYIKFTSNFFKNTPNIQDIEFSGSNGQDLPINNCFYNLTNLRNLQLYNMNISTLNESLFDSLKNLNTLDLHSNKLETLPETIFQRLQNLKIIDLNSNRFVSLPGQLFQNTKNLTEIKLMENANSLSLSNGLFSNLPNLKYIFLGKSNIKNITEDIFYNSPNILKISLQDNQIKILPELLFRDTKNLLKLKLNGNRIENIPEKLFKSLSKLEGLDLSFNQIKVISNIFENQINLQRLNIAFNLLTKLSSSIFERLINLRELALENNQLSFNDYNDPFQHMKELNMLDLSHNNIKSIQFSWRSVLLKLKTLNLKHNQIKSIEFSDLYFIRNIDSTLDLTNNLIETIRFSEPDIENLSLSRIQIHISNNPINCDCHIHNLLKYFKKEGKMVKVKLKATDLKCTKPKHLEHRDVKELELTDLFCPISCPEDYAQQCNCKVRELDKSTFMNCSKSYLTKIPTTLPQTPNYPNIKLYIDNNMLTKFHMNDTFANRNGYENVTELYMQNNQISDITWLPKKLKVLKLHSNNLNQININLLQNLKLSNLTLYKNPWKCSCNNDYFMNLVKYIRDKYFIFENITNIKCDDDETRLDLYTCEHFNLWILIPTLIVTMTITATLIIAFYKNERAIQVWCFAHKIFLWWVYKKENDLDKDKIYDAFVCHAHQDEDFVTQQLIPNLEECENPFKLCIHSRDWLAGVMIPDQIAQAIVNSKRTLVLLSPHFLESSWALQEFRVAHQNALDEGRSRVIVIKLCDVDKNKLDEELKAYLKLNTYIEWGHKTFWDNLRYALPHQKPLSNRVKRYSEQITRALGNKNEIELSTIIAQQIRVNQVETSRISQETESDINKDSLIMHELLDNIVQHKNLNRNIA